MDPSIARDNVAAKRKVDFALELAALGRHVFSLPTVVDGRCNCGRPADCGKDSGKHPLLGSNGFKDATTDPDTIRKMFDPFGPARNIGLRTGEVSGLTVIDIDDKPGKPGVQTWGELIKKNGEPQTLIASTPSGGFHVFFKYSPAPKTCVEFWKGIDIRNNDAYVVVAPSTTLLGDYEWLNPGTELLYLPEFLTRKESIEKKFKGRKLTLEALPGMLECIPNTDRDKWLAVFRILGFTYDRSDAAWKIATDWNSSYAGQRSPGDEGREHQAFYEDSVADVPEKQTIATLIHWAKEGGWVGASGTIANLHTAVSVLEDDPELCVVYYDEFKQRMLTGDPSREWTDHDDLMLTRRFQSEKNIPKMDLQTVARAVTMIAQADRRNQVRDWMDALVWDETPRIATFFVDYFGAEDNEFTKKVGWNFWISMPARVYKPGCQVDNVVVLEGAQGIRKSSALRVIGGEFFAEQHESVKQKDFYVNLQGKLLVEIGELHSFKSEVEKVKQIITAVSDRYRDPFGRRATDHPRQCVFVGTTNRSDWQKDETGGRRFWPIACGMQIDVEGIAANREQLFAEAVARFKSGKTWWEMPVEETLREQAARYTAPAWAEKIEWYINYDPHDPGEGVLRATPLVELTVSEVLGKALLKELGQWSKTDEMRVAETLTYLGWEKKRVRDGDRRPTIWFRKAPESNEKVPE